MREITKTDRLETLVNGEIIVSYVIKNYINNTISKIEHFNDKNELHREEDQPAYIYYYRNGTKELEIWYQNGKKHREDQPAVIGYHINGKKSLEYWYLDDKLHSPLGRDKPASIDYRKDGTISSEHWYKNGKLHRDEDKPAIIENFRYCDIMCSQYWYQNGKLHRNYSSFPEEELKPAIIIYCRDNFTKTEYYYNYGIKFNSIITNLSDKLNGSNLEKLKQFIKLIEF